MTLLNYIGKQLCKGAIAVSHKMDQVFIYNSIAGWILSSAAHLYAIKKNDSYSKEQKKFMKAQEALESLTNIGVFLLATCSIRKGVEKIIEGGKRLRPEFVDNFLQQSNIDVNNLSKGNTISEVLENMGAPQNIIDDFAKYKGNMRTIATVGMGVLASCALVPFVRNEVAAFYQNWNIKKTKKQNPTVQPAVSNKPAVTTNIPNTYINYTAGTVFDVPKFNNGGMKI